VRRSTEVGAPVRIVVPGEPVPWARARRRGGQYYTAPAVDAQVDAVQRAWMAAGRPRADDGDPLSVCLQFYLARPATHYRTGRHAHELRDDAPAHPTGKPDVDNLVKLPLDALNGLLFGDDAQIVCIASAGKHWCLPDEQPRTTIEAWVPGPPLEYRG
jgi:Holliday junction resolvase RusA-like endonuclease